jgi:DNA polymerase-1
MVESVVARTDAGVRAWLAELGRPAFVAVDTETSGWDPWCDRLLLVQVSAGADRPVLVVDAAQVDVAVLDPLLQDANVAKVFHHAAFDLRFLARAGRRVVRVADTMLAQQLLDGGESNAGLGLADMAAFRLGVTLNKDLREQFAGATQLSPDLLDYAAQDAAATWAVFDQQRQELVGHRLARVARLEFAALPVLADLALRGVGFDASRWQRLVGQLETRLPQLEQSVQQALLTEDSPHNLFGPEQVNLDAPEQVREALARVGVELETTREDRLRDFEHHPAVAALLAYRQVSKLTSNWGGDWARRVIHPVTGRIHADWRQIVGAGRIACRDPNLTQVPKDGQWRSCFTAAPGHVLVVADYSQQELRILAAVARDAGLTDVFQHSGDLHRATAALVFGVAEQDVQPAQRRAAKALNFGLMYGMGPASFARGTGMSQAQATATIDRYFAAFPRVAAWLAEAEAAGRRTGQVRTALGRVRVLPRDSSMGLATLARNAPIQGAGADMTKLALAEVERRMQARYGTGTQRDAGLVLTVHDELVVQVPAADAAEAADDVADAMRVAAADLLGPVPSAVDVAIRPHWGERGEAAA